VHFHEFGGFYKLSQQRQDLAFKGAIAIINAKAGDARHERPGNFEGRFFGILKNNQFSTGKIIERNGSYFS
jgi:hypothetical protein